MTLRPTALLFALAAPTFAWGQAVDTPERIVHLGYVEGAVAFQGADDRGSSALPERPLVPGDRLLTEDRGRAELAFGTASVRLDERTDLVIADLDETAVRVELNRGTASVQLHELFGNETFEVVTPTTTIALLEPGDYRIDVPRDELAELTVRSGAAQAETAGGPVRVADGQRVRFEGREALASLVPPLAADAFDDWVLDREVQLAEMEPSRDAPYGEEEYEELDAYGEWYDEPRYGRVWMPSYAYGGYAPFGYGSWQRVGFGWSWYDPMPWGYHTFNYGRWAYLDHLGRWCWVPARRDHRWQFANDVRPFGRPRKVDDRREPVASAQDSPRNFDADRAPTWRRDLDSAKRSQGGTFVPGVNKGPGPPQQSAPAPKERTAAMRPARTTESRREAASPPAARTSRAFATPQKP